MALAEKLKSSRALTVAFLGDGALGQGVVYESLNIASLWGAPILFVVENNRIAQTTPIELALAGEVAARFTAFGIPAQEMDTSDVLAIRAVAEELSAEVRAHSAPRALILHTCRFGAHSKGDDTRPAEEIARLRAERDPLNIHGARLTPAERCAIEAEANAEILAAFQQALADPLPSLPSSVLT
jgi:TPP-dependent pyruvate/acetoin dehydrogenase alpha subunit